MTNAQAPQSRIAAFLPSLTDVMFLLPLAFLLARAEGMRDLIEGDTGWHIRAGEWMLAHGQVARTDMFSFTRPGAPWFAWEWLWDVGAAFLNQRWGMAGVALASMLVLCLTSVLLFRLVLRMCPYRLAAAAITFVAVSASSVHWWVRPHLFTWLFTVMVLWVIAWHESGERRWLWTLPVLTVAWVNIHGGFLVIFIILGCYTIGHLLTGFTDYLSGGKGRPGRAAIPYFLTGLACLAASLINPYTYHLYQHVFGFFGGSKALFQSVAEWQSVSFQHPSARFFEVLIAGSAVAALHDLRKGRYGSAMLVIGWLHMALNVGRHIPIFAFVAAPLLGRALAEGASSAFAGASGRLRNIWSGVTDFEREFSAIDGAPRLYLTATAGAVLVAWAALCQAPPAKLEATFSPSVTRSKRSNRSAPGHSKAEYSPMTSGATTLYIA